MANRQPPQQEQELVVLGAEHHPFRDLYHALLRRPFRYTFALIASVYLSSNALFALAYLVVDGVEGAQRGSFADAFFFSVQTMGTIGYGTMHPHGTGANVLVVCESMFGMIITALFTGLVFAKFSISAATVIFSRQASIAPWDGVPTLSFRIGNDRSNTIVDAQMRLSLWRTETTLEGVRFYRMYELKLARDRTPALSRSWTALHPITEDSPLYGMTPDDLRKYEVELTATVVGIDDTSLQTVHARYRWTDANIRFGARHADVLSERPDGRLVLDVRKFHDLIPTTPTADFPYPRA
jgi:inward rectifier potassium channel